MTRASDNTFPKVILGPLGAPSAPADASWKVYPMADGIYAVSSNTTVGPLGAAGGSGVTVQDEGTPLATTGTTLDFVGAGVVASGTGATKTITIAGGSFTFSGARVTNATQNIDTATVTLLTWDTEAYDTDAYRDGGTPTRLTIPATGKYRVGVGGFFGFAESNELDVWVNINTDTSSSAAIGGQTLHTATGKLINVSFDYLFTAADYVTARLYHDNGSTRAFTVAYFTIQRLDP